MIRSKLKHANSILKSFEYICHVSSKSIRIISSYAVSKLGRFLRRSVLSIGIGLQLSLIDDRLDFVSNKLVHGHGQQAAAATYRRAFTVAGPTVWNSLPVNLRDPAISTDNFTESLKTWLFRKY